MRERTLRTATASILMLASALMAQPRRGAASGPSDSLPQVRGISIQNSAEGTVIVDIAMTHAVPYRTLLLSNPARLVVDLKGARNAALKRTYPAESRILEKVRLGQWRSDPAIVRVVADLKGTPVFSVKAHASGIRIEFKPRTAGNKPAPRSSTVHARAADKAGRDLAQTVPRGPAPKFVFPVHRFKDLSASLTAPDLPPQDRLVAVTEPDLSTSTSHKQSTALALVSGISITPESQGQTRIDIASTRAVPYRVFQLTDPLRLVIDLKDARKAIRRDVYAVDSEVLKSVRVAQWSQGGPAVVRVVADLEGYPIFDVHAQKPGIRIELRPRFKPGPTVRNPFDFAAQPQHELLGRPAGPADQATTAAIDSPAAAPGGSLTGLKFIGYVERQDSGMQAVISDRVNLYVVPEGGTFGNKFKVVSISSSGVAIQDVQTSQRIWLDYTP